MKEPFVIPIDDKIKEFKNHLESHPRTIFSAKFGDGKSYFLTKFKGNEDVCNEYKILTIHPVNYQVLENKDIFELIKRDILAQILVNGMITKSYDLSNSEALYYYLQGSTLDLVEDMLKIITPLGLEAPIIAPLLACAKSLKLFKKTRKKIEEIKQDANIVDKADAYIKQINNSKYIYEEDVYTKLIKDAIKNYRANNEKKKVVLIVEDMDRLDPAHLFRIMNVFSAHVDYCEKYGLENKELSCDNKYGFDNIVFVMDYDNTEKIFHHFYGKETDYKGYISKFASRGYYKYSLLHVAFNYYCKLISDTTNLSFRTLKLILANILQEHSIREIVESCNNVDVQIPFKPKILVRGKECDVHIGILRYYIIMYRLGYSRSKIIESITTIMRRDKENEEIILNYILGLWFFNEELSFEDLLYISNWSNKYNTYHLINIYMDGHVQYQHGVSITHNDEEVKDIAMLMDDLFNLIGL